MNQNRITSFIQLNLQKLKLILNYIKIKCKTVAAIKAKTQAMKIWLNSKIKFLYSNIQLTYSDINKITFTSFDSYTNSTLTFIKII